jgi:DNA polymerase-1
VLATLPYPEAKLISASKTIAKRLTMLSTGPKSWMNMASDDGRLHTEYSTLGTVTGRSTHSPNIAQVPSRRNDKDGTVLVGIDGGYGHECRSLFGPAPGWLLVGADMAGLELRCLAHYLYPYDGGAYAAIVCHGDPHTANQLASGVETRAIAKRLIYVFYMVAAITRSAPSSSLTRKMNSSSVALGIT